MIDLKKLLAENTMARTPFELRYLVAGRHVHPMQQFRQITCELGVADGALRAAEIGRRKRAAMRARLEREIAAGDWDEAEKRFEIEELNLADEQEARAFLGKQREVACLLSILERDFADWLSLTESEQLEHTKDYWVARLARSMSNEMIATGGVGPGLIEAVRQLPAEEEARVLERAAVETELFKHRLMSAKKAAELRLAASGDLRLEAHPVAPDFVPLKLLKDAPPGYPENRLVRCDHIDLVVGTLHRDIARDVTASSGFEVPPGWNFTTVKEECPSPDLIGDYKYRLALHAESLGARYLFILDDDVRAPSNTIRRLVGRQKDIVGAWYPKKIDPPASATLITDGDAKRAVPDGEGLLEVDWALTAGCTLYRIGALKRLPRPWFATTHKGTEDTYLTILAREHGVTSWLDRELRVEHIDKASGRAYRLEAQSVVSSTQEGR